MASSDGSNKRKRLQPIKPYKLRNRSTSTSTSASSSTAPHPPSDFLNKDDRASTAAPVNSKITTQTLTNMSQPASPIIPADLFFKQRPSSSHRTLRHSSRQSHSSSTSKTASSTTAVVKSEQDEVSSESATITTTTTSLPGPPPSSEQQGDRKGPGVDSEEPVSARLRHKRKGSMTETEDEQHQRLTSPPLRRLRAATRTTSVTKSEDTVQAEATHAYIAPKGNRRGTGSSSGQTARTSRRRAEQAAAATKTAEPPFTDAINTRKRVLRSFERLPRQKRPVPQLVTTSLPVDESDSCSPWGGETDRASSSDPVTIDEGVKKESNNGAFAMERPPSTASIVKKELSGDSSDDNFDLPISSQEQQQSLAALTFPPTDDSILDGGDIIPNVLPMTGEQIKQESERFFIEINLGLRKIEDVPPSCYFLAPDLREWIRKENQSVHHGQQHQHHRRTSSQHRQHQDLNVHKLRALERKGTQDTFKEMKTQADASSLASKIEQMLEGQESHVTGDNGVLEKVPVAKANTNAQDAFSLSRHSSKLQRELHITDTPLRPAAVLAPADTPIHADFAALDLDLPSSSSAFAPVDSSPTPSHSRSRDSSIDSTSSSIDTVFNCHCNTTKNEFWDAPYTNSHVMDGLCYHTIENALYYPSSADQHHELTYYHAPNNIPSSNSATKANPFFDVQMDWTNPFAFANTKQW